MVVEPEFENFLRTLFIPAQRALHLHNIKTFDQMFALGKSRLLKIHGIGPETIKKIEEFTGKKMNDE